MVPNCWMEHGFSLQPPNSVLYWMSEEWHLNLRSRCYFQLRFWSAGVARLIWKIKAETVSAQPGKRSRLIPQWYCGELSLSCSHGHRRGCNKCRTWLHPATMSIDKTHSEQINQFHVFLNEIPWSEKWEEHGVLILLLASPWHFTPGKTPPTLFLYLKNGATKSYPVCLWQYWEEQTMCFATIRWSIWLGFFEGGPCLIATLLFWDLAGAC